MRSNPISSNTPYIPRLPHQVPAAAPAQPVQQGFFQVQAAPQAAVPAFPVDNSMIIEKFLSGDATSNDVLRETASCIMHCFRAENLLNAIYLLANLRDKHEITYNAFIGACGEELKDLDKVLELYAGMKASEAQAAPQAAAPVFPGDNSMVIKKYFSGDENSGEFLKVTKSRIETCIRNHNLPNALYLLQKLKEKGIRADVSIYNTLIKAYGKANDLDKVSELYEEMKGFKIKGDASTYSALISAYGKSNNLDKVSELCKEMKEFNIKGNSLTYTALISAYGKSNDLDMVLKLYEEMKGFKIQGDAFTYNALISACEKSNNLDQALTFYKDMKDNPRIKCDLFTYTALIAACKSGMDIREEIKPLNLGVLDGVFQPQLGFSEVAHDSVFEINFHEPSIVSREFVTGGFDHPRGVALPIAEAVLIHHLQTNKFQNDSVKIELVVGCHGGGILKDGIQSFVASSFFASLFGKDFSYSLEQDRGNPGRLSLFWTRKK